MTAVKRGKLIESVKGCRMCTSWLHDAGGCLQKWNDVVRGQEVTCETKDTTLVFICQSQSTANKEDKAMYPRTDAGRPLIICPV